MEPWIQGLEDSQFADVTVVGKSTEGRSIYMIKVSTGPGPSGVPKKAIFLDASTYIHGFIGH